MTFRPGTSGLVVYSNTAGVAMIDPAGHTVSPIALNEYDYTIDPETGYWRGGQLGSEGGSRFDLALTPDGRMALISNFGDNKVFFVDLASGAPVVVGMAQIDFFAEDIAIDPTGTWALVTDGGNARRIARLHIPTRQWLPAGTDSTHTPPEPISYVMPSAEVEDENDPYYPGYFRSGSAVEIAADGRTVIVADYFHGMIHVLLLDPATGGLAVQQTEYLWKYGTDETAAFPVIYSPINVAISPDGRTVLVANASRSTSLPDDPDPDAIFEGASIAVFAIDRPGHVVRTPDVIMPYEVGGGQSIAFSPDGRRAFYETIYYDEQPDVPKAELDDWLWQFQEIQVLQVSGPGQVSRVGAVRTPTKRGTSQLFGVDTIAVAPGGAFLYVTNPTVSGASPVIDVIDLRTLTHVKQIGTPQNYPDPLHPDVFTLVPFDGSVLPVGIAFPQRAANEPPVAVIRADKAELILDINEVATFDGGGSYDPEGAALNFAWRLVSAPAGAAATLTPMGSTARLVPDPNVEGVYVVGLAVNDGSLDSGTATASVRAKFYPVYAPAAAKLERLKSDFIFYKEYVNRLSWAANPDNKSVIASVRIYRKEKGAGDSSYALLATLAAGATQYDDKGLAAAQLYSYRVTSVNTAGRESPPVVLGN
jgi:DNA-binding beta-propeller fold protein YncE